MSKPKKSGPKVKPFTMRECKKCLRQFPSKHKFNMICPLCWARQGVDTTCRMGGVDGGRILKRATPGFKG